MITLRDGQVSKTFESCYQCFRTKHLNIDIANFIPEKFLAKGFSNKGDLKFQENPEFVKSFLDAVMFEKH